MPELTPGQGDVPYSLMEIFYNGDYGVGLGIHTRHPDAVPRDKIEDKETLDEVVESGAAMDAIAQNQAVIDDIRQSVLAEHELHNTPNSLGKISATQLGFDPSNYTKVHKDILNEVFKNGNVPQVFKDYPHLGNNMVIGTDVGGYFDFINGNLEITQNSPGTYNVTNTSDYDLEIEYTLWGAGGGGGDGEDTGNDISGENGSPGENSSAFGVTAGGGEGGKGADSNGTPGADGADAGNGNGAKGGSGGDGTNYNPGGDGGNGEEIIGTVTMTPGQTEAISVGNGGNGGGSAGGAGEDGKNGKAILNITNVV